LPSLSRRLAAWAAALRYEDLPDDVVDRAKGLTLHALASAMLGASTAGGQSALRLMQEEDGAGPATVLVEGTKLTKGGAAFVNSEMVYAGGKWDTFRMLTHPGSSIVPAALIAAECQGASGRDYLTGLAAGYEVTVRLASDFIPSVMARGFHASPVFGIFGAAAAAAKIAGYDAEGLHRTLAECVSLASGNIESARSGGARLREGFAVRNAMLAVAMARQGVPAGETVFEGEAGFYHAFTGNNQGRLAYAFEGPATTDVEAIAEGLGSRWRMLETLYRIYSIAGYNIAHIDVTAGLCAEHGIRAADVERVEAVVNWMETQYPSPAFPDPSRVNVARPGSTHYYAAYAIIEGGFPLLKTGPSDDDPPEVADLLRRVDIVPSKTQPLSAPKITIHLKDGRSVSREATGREFIWDFEEEARRLRGVIPGLPVPEARFDDIVDACRNLDLLPRADDLIRLTLR